MAQQLKDTLHHLRFTLRRALWLRVFIRIDRRHLLQAQKTFRGKLPRPASSLPT